MSCLGHEAKTRIVESLIRADANVQRVWFVQSGRRPLTFNPHWIDRIYLVASPSVVSP